MIENTHDHRIHCAVLEACFRKRNLAGWRLVTAVPEGNQCFTLFWTRNVPLRRRLFGKRVPAIEGEGGT
jgi:hypothetical protein